MLFILADVSDGGLTVPEVDWNAVAQQTLQKILSEQPNKNVARNVILFLGDGMGISTITAGRIYSGQLKGQPGEDYQLSFDKFPNVALAKASQQGCFDTHTFDTVIMVQHASQYICLNVRRNSLEFHANVQRFKRWSACYSCHKHMQLM